MLHSSSARQTNISKHGHFDSGEVLLLDGVPAPIAHSRTAATSFAGKPTPIHAVVGMSGMVLLIMMVALMCVGFSRGVLLWLWGCTEVCLGRRAVARCRPKRRLAI